jgi:hypothetical protein
MKKSDRFGLQPNVTFLLCELWQVVLLFNFWGLCYVMLYVTLCCYIILCYGTVLLMVLL